MRLYEIRQKGAPLSDETSDLYVVIYRAQLVTDTMMEPMSYTTRSLKFAKDHAVHMANTEEEPYHVIRHIAKTSDVYHASNPGEYFYDGPAAAGHVKFVATPGDDFDELIEALNPLQKKISQQIEKQQGKGLAQHQVAGYRRTDSARALLHAQQDRQKFAIRWREKALQSGADSVRDVIVRYGGTHGKWSASYKVFSVGGKDVYAVAPTKGSRWGHYREIDIENGDFDSTIRDTLFDVRKVTPK